MHPHIHSLFCNHKSFITGLLLCCSSETKFDSGCGWPAYYDNIPGAVDRHVDNAYGMKRIEITCSNCGGHLGHVFEGEVDNSQAHRICSF